MIRIILLGIIILLILMFFRSLRGPIVVVIKRRQGESGARREPERIRQCIAILGLKPDASQEEITQAYKDLVNVWHPDRFESNERLQKKAVERLKEINTAYDHISSFYGWK